MINHSLRAYKAVFVIFFCCYKIINLIDSVMSHVVLFALSNNVEYLRTRDRVTKILPKKLYYECKRSLALQYNKKILDKMQM